jgi:hypothetical protein
MMIPWESITTLLSVMAGAAIAGAGALLRARDERKKAIATAVADLLEVHHRMLAVKTLTHTFKDQLNGNVELIPVIITLLNNLFPKDAGLHERFSESIRVISSVDPLLAFRMRSKDQIQDFLDNFALMNAQLPKDQGAKFESLVNKHIIPVLDEALLELSSAHSRSLHKKIKMKLKAPPPQEFLGLVDELKRALPQP